MLCLADASGNGAHQLVQNLVVVEALVISEREKDCVGPEEFHVDVQV